MNFTQHYLHIIHTKYKGLNLTRIQHEEDFYHKHYLDSVLPLREIPFFRQGLLASQKIIDVGFGGGFPLLPLACELPQKVFHGIEARKKKVDAVTEIAREMGIKNVSISHQRLEETTLETQTVFLFRAVGSIADCVKKIPPKHGLTCFFYKGPRYSPRKELMGLHRWKVAHSGEVSVPQTNRRFIIAMKPA